MGVILMPFWLTGRRGNGLEAVWQTVRRIGELTGGWEHVMIGSDLDGFTRPPREVPDAGRMGRLTRLFLDRGVTARGVRRIMGGPDSAVRPQTTFLPAHLDDHMSPGGAT